MRLDERFAVLLATAPLAAAALVGGAGAQTLAVALVVVVLATRLAAGGLPARTRDRLDVLVVAGVAAFLLIVVERVRSILSP